MNTYEFRTLLRERGCYSEITLDANVEKASNPQLTINYNADTAWEVSCKAGILVFFDYLKRKDVGKLTVTIENIKWLPVDTNHLTIIYSTISALSQQLNFEIEGLKLERIEETFIFPEPRAI